MTQPYQQKITTQLFSYRCHVQCLVFHFNFIKQLNRKSCQCMGTQCKNILGISYHLFKNKISRYSQIKHQWHLLNTFLSASYFFCSTLAWQNVFFSICHLQAHSSISHILSICVKSHFSFALTAILRVVHVWNVKIIMCTSHT